MFSNDRGMVSKRDYIWWRDLISVDIRSDSTHNFFTNNILCRLKNGRSILFWHGKWIGNQSLKDAYPEAFSIVATPFTSQNKIKLMLPDLVSDSATAHEFWWQPEDSEMFTVISFYEIMDEGIIVVSSSVQKTL
ncbi:unnamed protein product [Vicia faba]|uniref:Uncharacterized protein n=1 Tax=Vicia faba TaxID=3906 RepID=A0AAV0YV86_VICFA|nr:unnamed protein product [Vicia faba]